MEPKSVTKPGLDNKDVSATPSFSYVVPTSSGCTDTTPSHKAPTESSSDSAIYSEPFTAIPTNPAPSYRPPTVQLHSCVQVNNCVIRLLLGNIVDHAADVLVHAGGELSTHTI